jgi:hypothetical protein
MPCESSASEFLRSTITVCQDCEGDSRKKLERASSNKHCYNTLDDEQPLPRPVAQSPLQMAYSVRYHSRESPSSSVGTVEDCHAGSKLMRCIPHAEDEVRAGVQTSRTAMKAPKLRTWLIRVVTVPHPMTMIGNQYFAPTRLRIVFDTGSMRP